MTLQALAEQIVAAVLATLDVHTFAGIPDTDIRVAVQAVAQVLREDSASMCEVDEERRRATRYTPHSQRQRHGDHTCEHCGCLRYVHYSDGRCYTTDEMGARLRRFQRTGRWPDQDEVCDEETP